MKRLFMTLSLAAILVSASLCAHAGGPDVLNSFYHTFSNAQDVTWTEVDGMTRIGFTLNGQEHFAYYSDENLVVVAKKIKEADLPEQLQSELKSVYGGYAVSDIYEVAGSGRKEYCATVSGNSKQLILKGSKKWNVFLKSKA